MTLPRSTRLNWISIIRSMASRQNSPSTTIGTAKAIPMMVNALRNGRPAKLRMVRTWRGVRVLAESNPSIQERRKRRGAAGRMATAGASTTTFRSAVTTPSDAARRLIAKPARADHGVSAKSSAGRRKKP